jgi:hypothetical protein
MPRPVPGSICAVEKSDPVGPQSRVSRRVALENGLAFENGVQHHHGNNIAQLNVCRMVYSRRARSAAKRAAQGISATLGLVPDKYDLRHEG